MVADTQFQKDFFLLYTKEAGPSNSFDAGKQTELKQGRQQGIFFLDTEEAGPSNQFDTGKQTELQFYNLQQGRQQRRCSTRGIYSFFTPGVGHRCDSTLTQSQVSQDCLSIKQLKLSILPKNSQRNERQMQRAQLPPFPRNPLSYIYRHTNHILIWID
jgi:hypothetical protein